MSAVFVMRPFGFALFMCPSYCCSLESELQNSTLILTKRCLLLKHCFPLQDLCGALLKHQEESKWNLVFGQWQHTIFHLWCESLLEYREELKSSLTEYLNTIHGDAKSSTCLRWVGVQRYLNCCKNKINIAPKTIRPLSTIPTAMGLKPILPARSSAFQELQFRGQYSQFLPYICPSPIG